MPDIVLNALNIFYPFNNPVRETHCDLQFTKEETEAQTGQITCPNLNTWKICD